MTSLSRIYHAVGRTHLAGQPAGEVLYTRQVSLKRSDQDRLDQVERRGTVISASSETRSSVGSLDE